jgi:zinc finger protein BrlA
MMFTDQNSSYASSHSSGGSSGNVSFSSANTAYTPPPTHRESFDSGNLEDIPFIDYGSTSSISMPAMSNEELTGIPNMLFQMDYNKIPTDQEMFGLDPFVSAPYNPCHGLSLLPSKMPPLVSDLQSPISDLGSSQNDFVDPCQTFIDAYDSQSPACTMKMDSSPMSEYAGSGYSPAGSMYYMGFHDDVKSTSTTPSRSIPIRQRIREPLETSIALQHHTQSNFTNERRMNKKIRREGELLGGIIQYHERAKKECTFDGCGKKFKRQEHLKRHQTTHNPKGPPVPCEFCFRPFGRPDNLKAHILLHTTQKKSSRTDYHPGAKLVYERLNSKPRKSSSLNSSSTKQEHSATRLGVKGY